MGGGQFVGWIVLEFYKKQWDREEERGVVNKK